LSSKIDFGVFISVEIPSFNELLSEVKECEHLGYHSIWLSDHLIGMYGRPDAKHLECWTTLSALACATSRIRLGTLVLCNPFRHPPLLAKMAATLDAISGGRLEFGIGAGWHEPEFKAYGYPFERPAQRIRRLCEAVRIVKMMWMESSPSFDGRYYQIKDAYCSPKPVQKPHPPIMIGGGGEKLLLRVVAQHADVCNFATWLGRPGDYLSKLNILERHCESIGRDLEQIRKSWTSYVIVKEDIGEVEEIVNWFVERAALYYGLPADRLRPPISGTPDECVEQIQRYIDIGVSLFILMFVGGDSKGQAKLFAEEVVPAFR
jgi:F420-dependent oxidoreductase-like protein